MMETEQVVAFDRCYTCANMFPFYPETVPSVLVHPETNYPPDLCPCGDPKRCKAEAIRKPLCPACVRLVNAERGAQGLPPHWRMRECDG